MNPESRDQRDDATVLSGMVDLCQFGLDATLLDCPPAAIEGLREGYDAAGKVRQKAKKKAGALHLVVDEPIIFGGRDCGHATVELFVEPQSDTSIRITNRSSLRVNGLIAWRRFQAGAGCGPAGLDGKENVVGPTVNWSPQALQEQIAIIATAIDTVVDGLLRHLPEGTHSEDDVLRLKSVEFTRDREVLDAITATFRAAPLHFPGEKSRRLDIRESSHDVTEAAPSVRWRFADVPAFLKVYPKRADLLRFEISCLSRRAVARLTGRRREEVGGAGASILLHEFCSLAAELLDDLEAPVLAASGSILDPVEVVEQLSRLVRPDRSAASGTPSQWSQNRECRRAFSHLLLGGSFDAKGARLGTTLRNRLEELAAPGGPLIRGSRPTIYLLRHAATAP